MIVHELSVASGGVKIMSPGPVPLLESGGSKDRPPESRCKDGEGSGAGGLEMSAYMIL